MSTENALVTLLREGVSVNEESVDSKRDLEDALRIACNDFIDHTCKSMAEGVLDVVDKLQSTSAENRSKEIVLSASSVKDMLTTTTEKIEVTAGEVTTQMSLYLDNPATQSILLKPISKKVTKGLEEVRKYACDASNEWDDSIQGEVLMLISEVEEKVKASAKVSK